MCRRPARIRAVGWCAGHLARNIDFLPAHTPVLRPLLVAARSGSTSTPISEPSCPKEQSREWQPEAGADGGRAESRAYRSLRANNLLHQMGWAGITIKAVIKVAQ